MRCEISCSKYAEVLLVRVEQASALQIEASTIAIAARKAESGSSCQHSNPPYINSMNKPITITLDSELVEYVKEGYQGDEPLRTKEDWQRLVKEVLEEYFNG